jgi:hypothetical protein
MPPTIRTAAAALIFALALPPHSVAQAPPPVLRTLYSFTGQNGDGSAPMTALVIGKNSALYGTTSAGGVAGAGSVFQLQPPAATGGAWTETVIYSFPSTPGCCGISPNGLTLGVNGAIYGTTYLGGSGGGTVFELKPPAAAGEAWTETVLYAFTGQDGDGASPGNYHTALVFANDGSLFGSTLFGGITTGSCAPLGCGTVFKLTRVDGAWKERVLYTFTGQNGDGAGPEGVALGQNGVLYGVTFSGGISNLGTAFELAPPAEGGGAWTETVIHTFAGPPSDGYGPNTSVIVGQAGMLYGSTFGNQNQGPGLAFQLTPSGTGGTWVEDILFNFQTTSYGPNGLVLGAGGTLYGTEDGIGAGGAGTVFELRQPAAGREWGETILYSFTGGNDGGAPWGPLVIGANGALYGTTSAGGTAGLGTVFELDR